MHDVATIVSLVETARTRVTAVTATMALGDQLAAAVATTQLHACLEELRSRAPNYPHAASVVADALGKYGSTRGRAIVSSSEVQRLLRWMSARHRSASAFDPHLFEAYVTEQKIGRVSFERLCITASVFRACDLRGSVFDTTLIEGCDFSRSNLARTSWLGARVVRCDFSGADLSESTIDAATFVDCTFRGSDFVPTERATATGTLFVRCGPRESVSPGRATAQDPPRE